MSDVRLPYPLPLKSRHFALSVVSPSRPTITLGLLPVRHLVRRLAELDRCARHREMACLGGAAYTLRPIAHAGDGLDSA
jgi:hypothetical protein